MSDKAKKIFLGISIALPFLLYCVYYYTVMVKNAPYKFAEFESITLKAGLGSNYDKIYNSKSQIYQYTNANDSVIKSKVKLSKDDLLYLHRKAAELGFWNWPQKMVGDTSGKSPRYFIEYQYQRKSKIMEIDGSYDGSAKLKDAALELTKTIDKIIQDADEKQN
jgi:hypothetical protein